jgi:hypothetical protein
MADSAFLAPFGPRRGAAGSDRATGPSATVPSLEPCAYSVKRLLQDATGGTATCTNGVFAPQGSAYRIRMSWTPLAGPVYGWLSFRVIDSFHSYVLLFYSNQTVGLSVNKGGVYQPTVRIRRVVDGGHPALFTLVMNGSTFTVLDDALPGSPTLFAWTDPDDVAPYGGQVNHSTAGGSSGRWDFAIGTPL